MYIINEEDYLSHYGRKGMKWYQHIFGDNKKNNGDIRKKIAKNIYNTLTHPYSTLAKSAVTVVKGKALVDSILFYGNLGKMRLGHHLRVAAQIPKNPMAIASFLSGIKYDKDVYNYNKEKYKERKRKQS